MAALEAEEIESLIRIAGLGKTKSERMKQILDLIHAEFGAYSIDAMLQWEPQRARDFLGALPGIGPKTVACVLVFDLGMPAFPVDTHVDRLSHKLGWVLKKCLRRRHRCIWRAFCPRIVFEGRT